MIGAHLDQRHHEHRARDDAEKHGAPLRHMGSSVACGARASSYARAPAIDGVLHAFTLPAEELAALLRSGGGRRGGPLTAFARLVVEELARLVPRRRREQQRDRRARDGPGNEGQHHRAAADRIVSGHDRMSPRAGWPML